MKQIEKQQHHFFLHLYDLKSRIWLKNRFITLNEIKRYEKQISKLRVKLSLFEVLTLIYILAAAKAKCSYNLLESGLLFKKIVQISLKNHLFKLYKY